MYSSFKNWIIGIEEDDPLPFEIKYLYIYVCNMEIGFGGRELKNNIIADFEYFPLDAQYYELSSQFFKNDNLMIDLKLAVESMFDDADIRKIFLNKVINIGYLFEKPVYTFVVK